MIFCRCCCCCLFCCWEVLWKCSLVVVCVAGTKSLQGRTKAITIRPRFFLSFFLRYLFSSSVSFLFGYCVLRMEWTCQISIPRLWLFSFVVIYFLLFRSVFISSIWPSSIWDVVLLLYHDPLGRVTRCTASCVCSLPSSDVSCPSIDGCWAASSASASSIPQYFCNLWTVFLLLVSSSKDGG